MQGEGGAGHIPWDHQQHSRTVFECVCGNLGAHNPVLAPKCAVLGAKAQISQEPLRRGWLGRAAGSGDKVTPQRLGLPGGMLGAGPLPWEASVELSTHKLISKAGLGAL